ncbi:MAG: hypothetical protein H6625_09735 [Bdellovibrionaceae bacterium]|nr:hypothetical protein [Pseudobdellovibrionaceae bacterium]
MSIELSIRNMLNEGNSLAEVAETMLMKSADSHVARKELYQISQFFVLAGLYKDLFRQFPRRFFERELIAWPHFIEILIINKISISNSIIQSIYEGCQETKSIQQLALNKKWITFDIRFQKIRQDLWDKKNKNLEKLRRNLKQKIEFLKNQRLIEDEKKAYLKYKEVFPEDKSIDSVYEDFKERQARELVNKKMEQRKVKEVSFSVIDSIDANDEIFSEILFKEALKISKENPHFAYNLSVMFTFFDMYNKSLKILEDANADTATMWLRLELLLLAEDYFKVLNEAEKLESKIDIENADDNFALIYIKAQAYSFLKQQTKAVELLKSILRIRPNYRSAQTLLNEILGEGQ